MPKYDVTSVTKALNLIKAGELPQAEIARLCDMGVSTLQRHVVEYMKGNRPDIDVGELSPRRAVSAPRMKTPAAPTPAEASFDRIQAEYRAKLQAGLVAHEQEYSQAIRLAERAKAQALQVREELARLEGGGE
ncbi:hypothetical protein [Novosphingobium sp.]|uniref:hypothetical protein n=1 Tax=Novosphingobium sp. TaxID=1874826 RepID=UPI003B51EC65